MEGSSHLSNRTHRGNWMRLGSSGAGISTVLNSGSQTAGFETRDLKPTLSRNLIKYSNLNFY